MKASIFNMNFTLPPMVEMTEVEKGMPTYTDTPNICRTTPLPLGDRYENLYL